MAAVGDYESPGAGGRTRPARLAKPDRKSTRLNSSHRCISYAVFCLKKKKESTVRTRDWSARARNPLRVRERHGSSPCARLPPGREPATAFVPASLLHPFFFFNDRAPPEFSPLPPPEVLRI